jgi:hypothetical protein
MGLWDLVPDEIGTLHRVRNPVADRFLHHATSDVASRGVGITEAPAAGQNQNSGSQWPVHI